MNVAEIMVLPPIENGRPQILFNSQGIWTDLTPSPDTLDRELFRKNVENFLLAAMTSVSQGNDVNPSKAGFRNQCRSFFNDLLPADLQKELARVAAQPDPMLRIYLHRSSEWIPWELLHDGTDYLGLRMHVVRLPLMANTERLRDVTDRSVKKVFNLLGRDILDPALIPQWQQTFATVAGPNGWETRCPETAGAPMAFASWDELEAAKDAQIVHVTCHGGLRDNDKSAYYWSFDLHGQPFNVRITVEGLQSGLFAFSDRPLVFGNACASAGAASNGGLHGLGAAFMVSGALNFVGTIAPITQQASIDFATAFYSNLLDPAAARTIADALLTTKLSFKNRQLGDPSYLFYCLYGPPHIKYKV
jgi:hypothetical protein